MQLCLLLLLRDSLLFLFMFFGRGNKLGSRILDKVGRHTSVENSPSGAEMSCGRLKAVINNLRMSVAQRNETLILIYSTSSVNVLGWQLPWTDLHEATQGSLLPMHGSTFSQSLGILQDPGDLF